mgnify:CR=1 FL=1
MNIEFSFEQWKKQQNTILRKETVIRGMTCFTKYSDIHGKQQMFFPAELIQTLSSDRFPGTLTKIEYYTLQSFTSSMHLDKVIIDFNIGIFVFKLLVQMTHDDSRLLIGWHRPSSDVPLPDGVKLISEAVVEFLSEHSPNRLHMTSTFYSKEEAMIVL